MGDAAFAKDVLAHHERWDGKGYPRGLKQTQIPLTSRIIAVADSYDAMTYKRPYRDPMGHQQACEEVKRCSGSQFDPKVVEAFLACSELLSSH
ncbi:MAG: HD domain-containing protein [Sphaerochaeta sp.]|nr:HD domain-containing protein [Sphaerochaeta sp.]